MKIFKARGLSRLLEHLQGDHDLAVVSAYRSQFSEEENLQRHQRLMSLVRRAGYGYFVLNAKWSEHGEVSEEKSLLVPNMDRQTAIDFGHKFDQTSILTRGEAGVQEVASMDRDGHRVGEVIRTFSRRPSISESDFVGAFSQLSRGKESAREKRVQLRELVSLRAYTHGVAYGSNPDGSRPMDLEYEFQI